MSAEKKKPVKPPKVAVNTEIDAFMLFNIVYKRPLRWHKLKRGGEFWVYSEDLGNPPYNDPG